MLACSARASAAGSDCGNSDSALQAAWRCSKVRRMLLSRGAELLESQWQTLEGFRA